MILYNCICRYCGKEFQAKYESRKYCSRKCMGMNRRKKFNDLIGKRFGRLVVVRRESKDTRHPHLICNCDCGNQISVNVEHLLTGRTKSCGCLRIKKTFVETTSLNTINSKLRSDNTSGVRGVTWCKARNKWNAHIGFKKKKYNLGYYTNIQDAITVRKKCRK